MSDLISRSALLEEVKSLTVTVTGLRAGKGVLHEYAKQYRDTLLRIIDEQPTVEAVPVVHGEWKHRANHGDYLYCDCSVCGYRTENFNAIAEFGKHNTEYIREKWHFCPNCGARMKGGAE